MARKNGSLPNTGELRAALEPWTENARSGNRRSRRKDGRVTRIESVKPTERDGNSRHIAQVKFPDGSEVSGYIPSGEKGIKEGSLVFLRASRSRKASGVYFQEMPSGVRIADIKPTTSAQLLRVLLMRSGTNRNIKP